MVRQGSSPAGGWSTLVRDAEGVQGLHILCNAFSEDFERRLWALGNHSSRPACGFVRSNFSFGGSGVSGRRFPQELFQLINAANDCGLYPHHEVPNSGFILPYARGTGIFAHYDEEHSWGETILGISLGADCTLVMTPDDRPFPGRLPSPVHILLPRRSLYVLSGPARYSPGYQHSIKDVGTVGGQPPAWNPSGERRSITLRSTTAYALDMLRCELATCTRAEQQRRASLKQRISALCSKAGGRLAPMKALVVQQALVLRASRHGTARLRACDAPFVRDLPLHLAVLYPGAQQPAQADALPQLARGAAPLNAAAAQLQVLEQERQARRLQGQQPRPPQRVQQAQQQQTAAGSRLGQSVAQRPPAAVAAGAAAAARARGLRQRQQQAAAVEVVDLTGEDEAQPPIPAAAAAERAAGGSRKRVAGEGTGSRAAKQRRQQQGQGGVAAEEVISLLSDDSDAE